MSLSLSYELARSALGANSGVVDVTSRNIANANNPNASRKLAQLTTSNFGGVQVSAVNNLVDDALLERSLRALSDKSALAKTNAALERLGAALSGHDAMSGISGAFAELKSSLQLASARPSELEAARALLVSAKSVARALTDAAGSVEQVRLSADAEIASGVSKFRDYLDAFATVNAEIVEATRAGREYSDQWDRRVQLLRDMSELADVRAVARSNNDLMLTLSDGTIVFETSPRSIAFTPSASLGPATSAPALRVDGIVKTGSGANNIGGSIGGNLRIRDELAPQVGMRLDEIARALITGFAEKDQSIPATLPNRAGLFTFSGGPSVPAAGVWVPGLALDIQVNANADPERGGSLDRLRDGGISEPGNAAYLYTASGETGDGSRLRELISALSMSQAFDPVTGLAGTGSIVSQSSDASAWLSGLRQQESNRQEAATVMSDRLSAAWRSSVGINLDDELAMQIQLERSYQASARILSTVNSMFDALLEVAR